MSYHTPARRWAQERNWTKAQLMGIKANCQNVLHKDSTTLREQTYLDEVIFTITKILVSFKNVEAESKAQFLGRREM